MNRNYLDGPQGDAINAALATTGYDLRLPLLNWLMLLLCLMATLILLRSTGANRLQIS